MSYPKNAATPPRIAVGPVVQISDGAVQSSGVSVVVRAEGGSETAGGGTISYGGSSNVVYYAPTQAETNYTAFVVTAYKTGCVPVSVTVVTEDTSTAGRVVPAAASITNAALAADSGLKPLYVGAVTSGSATTYVMSGVTAANDNLNGYRLRITSGAMIGQVRMIKDWVSGTSTLELDAAFSTALSAADTFVIEPAQVNVKHVNDQLASGSGTPDVNVASTSIGAITSSSFAAGAINAAAIASDAITDAKVASDVTIASVTGAVGSVTGNVGGNVTGSVGSVVGAVGSVTGAVGSVTGAVGSVTGNVGGNVTGSVGSVVGAVGSVSGNVGGNVTGSIGSVATGGITTGSFAAGAINAAAIATGAIDADALATDAIAEISDGVWDEAIAGHLGVGSTGEALGAAGSAGDPWTTSLPGSYSGTQAGKILADVLVDTAEIGPAGAGLTNINLPNQTMDIVGNITGNLSGSVGSVTGAVTLPTIPVDWLTASGLAADAVTEIQSGLATAANLATLAGYVDTEVAAIKAKTDNLPSDPADQSAVEAAITAATSGLASQASVNTIDDFLDTEIAAIKAKTDNLPTDPADQSAVEAAITAATSPLATAANLATVAGYLDTEIAAILADTNELQTDWANGGRLDLLLDQALAAALLARQILGNKHTVQLNTPSAGLHTITVRNDDDTATVRTIVYNSATGARTVS